MKQFDPIEWGVGIVMVACAALVCAVAYCLIVSGHIPW